LLLKEITMLRSFTTAAILALGITAAHADDASTDVAYGDLDLSRASDARVLAARLQDAASTVCLKANPENIAPAAMRTCIDVSVSMAMTRIESSLDQAVHAKLINVRTAMEGP
jgi:UrcA family protein